MDIQSCVSLNSHDTSLSCVTSVVEETKSLANFDISKLLSTDAEAGPYVALPLTFAPTL
jgi:hypothetical protein